MFYKVGLILGVFFITVGCQEKAVDEKKTSTTSAVSFPGGAPVSGGKTGTKDLKSVREERLLSQKELAHKIDQVRQEHRLTKTIQDSGLEAGRQIAINNVNEQQRQQQRAQQAQQAALAAQQSQRR